jgi:hypothetical protein
MRAFFILVNYFKHKKEKKKVMNFSLFVKSKKIDNYLDKHEFIDFTIHAITCGLLIISQFFISNIFYFILTYSMIIIPSLILIIKKINIKKDIKELIEEDNKKGILYYFKNKEFIKFAKSNNYAKYECTIKKTYYKLQTEIKSISDYEKLNYSESIILIEESYEEYLKKFNYTDKRDNIKFEKDVKINSKNNDSLFNSICNKLKTKKIENKIYKSKIKL